MSTVNFSHDQGIARITLNRANKHNALTQDMWQQIADYCELVAKDKTIRVLILAADGDKSFCAGADIAELTEMIQDEARLKANNTIVQQAQLKLQNLSCATIAAISGNCIGGGMGLALACDFRVAVEQANFAITPSKLGLLYSVEDTKRIVNLVGVSKAKTLLFLGEKIDATKALDWGLINCMTSPENLTQEVNSLTQSILNVSGQSIVGIKQTLDFIATGNGKESHIRSLFDEAFAGEDFKEGAAAFLEKRKAQF